MMSDGTQKMTPEFFVDLYYEKVVDSNLAIYKDLYLNGKTKGSPDPISDKILKYTNSVSSEDCEALILLLRQAMVDTSSNVFGIIDGISDFGCPGDRFKLLNKDNEDISGDLQALFLELDEERRLRCI